MVQDDHDRYANIEVAFLPARMESEEGIGILGSNLCPNIDARMTTYKTPGVYIDELVPRRSIEDVDTSTAGLIGVAARGPFKAPIRITSRAEFRNRFGEPLSVPGLYLTRAIRGFFDNGGTVCYIKRVPRGKGKRHTIELAELLAALAALENVNDVKLVCVPGLTDAASQSAVIAHCERLRNRFAILDSPLAAPPLGADSVLAHRSAIESPSGFAALYYPWIRLDDATLVPPSGHIAGIFARNDKERGVHKAPANQGIRDAIGLERDVNHDEGEKLQRAGVNVLRIIPGVPEPVVWGARTIAPSQNIDWRYVDVRRLLLFVDESIRKGLEWAVFEPNGPLLWKEIESMLVDFLTRLWRSGALVGERPDDAFYARIDEALNPASDQNRAALVLEIGIAPVAPGEFIVVRVVMRPEDQGERRSGQHAFQ